jgi:hypothetical protein
MFKPSRLKVERAEKHILDLYNLLGAFPSDPNFHSVSIEEDNARYGIKSLVITIHKSTAEFLDEAALIIGDALHNLRGALDILYFEVVRINGVGLASGWTRFPITNTRQELIAFLNGSLKKQQISRPVYDLILDTIKPYRDGNFRLWSLHEMNIIDKHRLLIPTYQVMGIEDICLQNDQSEVINIGTIFTDASCRIRLDSFKRFDQFDRFRLDEFLRRSPTVKDKGHVSIGQGFLLETPNEGGPVIPTLNAVTKEITRTIEVFSSLLCSQSSVLSPVSSTDSLAPSSTEPGDAESTHGTS